MSTNYFLVRKDEWERYKKQSYVLYQATKEAKELVYKELEDTSLFTPDEQEEIYKAFSEAVDYQSKFLSSPQLYIGVTYCSKNGICFVKGFGIAQPRTKEIFWRELDDLCLGKRDDYLIINEYEEELDWSEFEKLIESSPTI